MPFRFEGLEIFQLAVDFARMAYQLSRPFPKEEIFGLRANLRRAATSVALNIAEGAGRGTRRDFAHFLDVASGSVFETLASFLLAERLGYFRSTDIEQFRKESDRLARKLNSFKRTLSGDKR
jgi:four helix bundle protein